MIHSVQTSQLQVFVDQLADGDLEARDDLIAYACDRLRVLTRSLSRGDRVRRYADTDDVLDGAVIALRDSLRKARPGSVAEFLRLAGFHIRRELTRLAREYYGPSGWATKHILASSGESWFSEALELRAADESAASQGLLLHEEIERLHLAIDSLSDELRDVVDLLWLHGLKQREAADLLGVTTKTVRRRWVRARLRLHRTLSAT